MLAQRQQALHQLSRGGPRARVDARALVDQRHHLRWALLRHFGSAHTAPPRRLEMRRRQQDIIRGEELGKAHQQLRLRPKRAPAGHSGAEADSRDGCCMLSSLKLFDALAAIHLDFCVVHHQQRGKPGTLCNMLSTPVHHLPAHTRCVCKVLLFLTNACMPVQKCLCRLCVCSAGHQSARHRAPMRTSRVASSHKITPKLSPMHTQVSAGQC